MADLVAALTQLRLYGTAACYAEGLEQGQPTMTTAAALLTQLVQAELPIAPRAPFATRCTWRASRCIAISAGFDFDQAKVDRRQILGFASTTFTEQAENLVLIGGTGTGKTHLSRPPSASRLSRGTTSVCASTDGRTGQHARTGEGRRPRRSPGAPTDALGPRDPRLMLRPQ